MTTAYDVPPNELIGKLAEKLKKDEYISPPEWMMYAKTGVNREVPPETEDWWFIRCGSLLRRIYIDGPVGVARLRTYYGGRERRGLKKERFTKGSGSIIREMLRQLEEAEYIRRMKEGRVISSKGQYFIDNTAYEVKLALLDKIPGLKRY
jgi:small subunit ribosomal protein S19e